jgi:hypothetical protein
MDDIVEAIEEFGSFICDVDIINLVTEYWMEDDPENKQWILYEDLWDTMDAIAPSGCYFGARRDDGADIGFWEDEDIF